MDGFDMEDKSIDYLKGHKTYMEYLAENGYHCALSGKWHMGDNITKKKGFEYYFTIGRGGCHYYDADIFEDGELYCPIGDTFKIYPPLRRQPLRVL